MNEIRSQIIGNIRASLGRGALSNTVEAELRARISEPEQGIRPHFDQDLAERFDDKLRSVAGTLSRVATINDVPDAIQQYLDQHNLSKSMVMSSHAVLDGIGWPEDWQIEHRPARGEDTVSVTGAYAGIAETGTVAILSGADSPSTLNFLPDNHIVVIRMDQLVSHFEDLWWLLRKQDLDIPRTINLITGPSRTADVEQTIQLGAHGPRRFHVVLVEQKD